MTRRALAHIAGAVWCAAALGLLARAVGFWGRARAQDHRSARLLAITIAIAAVIGVVKGLLILRRAAARNLDRIERLPEPARPWDVFAPWYVLLVGAMIALGVAVRAAAAHGWLGGWAGALGIYVAVAAALLSSSGAYFRFRA